MIGLKLSRNGMKDRFGLDATLDKLRSDITMIACDITHQIKVEFPSMAYLYGKDEDSTNPAEFVRASMSVPLFFKPHTYEMDNYNMGINRDWEERFGYKEVSGKSHFVDGGIISNFPISVLHNPDIKIPRLPILGIRLLNENIVFRKPKFPSFISYVSRVFSTMRFHHDKDFLMKNRFYEKYIGYIDVQEFNWLNFAMSDEEKVSLFLKGAKSAASFLISFDWDNYKKERSDLYDSLRSS